MTLRPSIILLAALLALPACSTTAAGGAGGRQALLSDGPTAPGRPCRVSPAPARLPSAAALVDSAALTQAAVALWRAAGAPRGHVLLAMAYERDGTNVRRDLLEHRLPQELADTLQKLVFAHRRAAEPAEHEWGVRLRMDLAEEPVLRVGRREVCAAHPRDTRVAGGALGGAAFGDVREREAVSGLLPSTPGGAGTVWVRVALDAGGNVTEAQLERTLARGTWERRVISYVRAISFVPATEDGWPVPAQITFPLRLSGGR
jgi:TonB family protein